MTQQQPRPRFTIQDYMATPEDKRYQLLDGEITVAPLPSVAHQRILGNLVRSLIAILADRDLGQVWAAPLDVVLSEYDVVQPDVSFVAKSRAYIVTGGYVQGAPDLIVEVLDIGTVEYDRGYKCQLYGRHGVKEYWMVDPDSETIDVLGESEDGIVTLNSFGNTGDLLTPLMNGQALDLDGLFRGS